MKSLKNFLKLSLSFLFITISSFKASAITGLSPKDQKLMEAISQDDYGRVRDLVREGANINAQEEQTRLTPLHLAITLARTDILKFLLGHKKIDTYMIDVFGQTALLYAFSFPLTTNKLTFMIINGMNPDIPRITDRKRALDIAEEMKRPDLISTLRCLGAQSTKQLEKERKIIRPPLFGKRPKPKQRVEQKKKIEEKERENKKPPFGAFKRGLANIFRGPQRKISEE